MSDLNTDEEADGGMEEFCKFAEPMGTLTNEEIDNAIYGLSMTPLTASPSSTAPPRTDTD